MTATYLDARRRAKTAATETVLLLAFFMLSGAEPAPQGPLKKANWAVACDLAAEAGKVPSLVLQNLKTNAATATTAFKTLLKLQIYAAFKGPGPQVQQTRAIWTYLATKAANAMNFGATAQAQKQITSVVHSARFEGSVMEFINLLADTGADDSHGCLDTAETGTTLVKGKSNLKAAHATCELSWEDVMDNPTSINHFGQAGTTHTKASGEAAATATGDDKDCNINTPNNANKLLNDGAGANIARNKISLGGNLFSIDGTGIKLEQTANVATMRTSHPFLFHAHAAATTTKLTSRQFSTPTAESLSDDEDFREVGREYILGKKRSDNSGDNELAAKIKATYTGTSALDKIFGAQIAAVPVPANLTDDNTASTLDKIDDIHELMRIYYYYADRSRQSLLDQINSQQQATANTKATESDETCETKGTGDNCKEGCKVEGTGENKKCVKDPDYKPKQAEGGVKSENDAKTANTTGSSNSFLINKAPLLIAFLLF
uniref:Variant surface glycoprotein 1125.1674 n=1 Tax=Trypanosoma brucei TaxID=5691 RepID=A0A1J0R7I7_9TRYP|nr:variant surface glycoprotein 1125.1674 [Trypanosoma brucei]